MNRQKKGARLVRQMRSHGDIFIAENSIQFRNPTQMMHMKAPQKICLTICIFVLTGSALAGSFDRPSPLIPNNVTNPE